MTTAGEFGPILYVVLAHSGSGEITLDPATIL